VLWCWATRQCCEQSACLLLRREGSTATQDGALAVMWRGSLSCVAVVACNSGGLHPVDCCLPLPPCSPQAVRLTLKLLADFEVGLEKVHGWVVYL
jgi:hypothetical protein